MSAAKPSSTKLQLPHSLEEKKGDPLDGILDDDDSEPAPLDSKFLHFDFDLNAR